MHLSAHYRMFSDHWVNWKTKAHPKCSSQLDVSRRSLSLLDGSALFGISAVRTNWVLQTKLHALLFQAASRIVNKLAKVGLNGALCSEPFLASIRGQSLHAADHLRLYAKRAGDLNDLGSSAPVCVDFHSVPHVEYLVHLLPRRAALLVYDSEQRGHREQVVLDHVQAPAEEVQNLRLAAPTAVHLGPALCQHPRDDRGVGAGRG